jgi:hypothetical protein
MITITHLTGCDANNVATSCCTKETTASSCLASCSVYAPQFSGPDYDGSPALGSVEAEIYTADGGSDNVIGSSDGYIEFTITSGPYWPVYGGLVSI